jgi:hypothetical protein
MEKVKEWRREKVCDTFPLRVCLRKVLQCDTGGPPYILARNIPVMTNLEMEPLSHT